MTGRSPGLVPRARLAGPMAWVIAIMVALTVIAAAGGLALARIAENARQEISGGLTVQIVEAAPAERARQVEVAVALLSNRPDVTEVTRVSDAELAKLIEPWLGEQAPQEEDAIPIPALIDVKLAGPVTVQRLDALRAALATSVPAARVDAQAGWLAPVFDAVASLQWLSGALIALLAATSSAAVWLAARNALGANHDTVEIVHLLGGTDDQIARVFQRSIGIDAAIGSVIGLMLGALATWTLGRQFARLGSGMIAGGGLTPLDWAVLAGIPAAGVVLAMLTARVAVLASLRRIL